MRDYIIKALGGYSQTEWEETHKRTKYHLTEALNRALGREDDNAERFLHLEYKFEKMLKGNKQKYNGRTVIAVPVCNRKRNKQGKYCK